MRQGRLVGLIALLAAAGGTWRLFSSGKGAALPAGAIVNEKHAFAAVFPADWKPRLNEDCRAERAPCEALRLMKDAADPNASPYILLTRLPGPPIFPSEGSKEALAAELQTEMASLFDKPEWGEPELSEVDGLSALKLAGKGPKRLKYTVQGEQWMNEGAYTQRQFAQGAQVVHYTARYDLNRPGAPGSVKVQEGVYEDRDYAFVSEGWLFPGRTLMYQLVLKTEKDSAASDEAVFRDFLNSLRVLERPRPADAMGWKEGAAAPQLLLCGFVVLGLFGLFKLLTEDA